jgi:hypothetical protein
MKQSGPYLTLALGVILLIVAGLGYSHQQSLADPGNPSLPASIAGLERSRELYGEEAVVEITMLHGGELPLASGAMGSFGDQWEISLWAASAPDISTASQMTADMQQAIAKRRSPFTPVSEWEQGGRTIQKVSGLGQEHFYFQAGRLVIWLAAEPLLAQDALRETLEYYR